MRLLRAAALTPFFPVGGPVPADDLVGREGYLRRAVERLADGQHLLVAGPRRIGKTSIVLEALRRLRRRGALTAYVDCLGATDARGLAQQLAGVLLPQLGGADRAARELELARERTATRALERSLDLPGLIAARSRKRVVIAFDEFQAAGRVASGAFDVMRTHFQAQHGVAFVFLGSEEGLLATLFSEKGRAFYRFAVPLDLLAPGGPRFGIAPEDWHAYLRRKFAARRIALGESDADRLLDLTGGHPQDTMQLCAALYELAREEGARSIDSDLVALAYEQTLRELDRAFALHWTELGSQKYLQPIAKRVAHAATLYAADAPGGAVPRAEVLRALESLRARGLVVRLGRGRYEFVEPMLGEYVRRLDAAIGMAIVRR